MADLSNKTVRFPRPLKRVSVTWCGGTPVSALQAEDAERAAMEKGRFDALTELTEQVSVMREDVSKKQDQFLDSLATQSQGLMGKISERIPKLVVMAAAKVIEGLELEPSQVASIVDTMLAQAPDEEQLELRLNPEDLQLLRGIHQAAATQAQPDPAASDEDFTQALSGLFGGGGENDDLGDKYPSVTFVEDDTLGRGDCLLESRYGLVDGRVATRLSAIEESMSSKA
jgi:flagellar biosynthesis/type III secretory pathway protein FliH